MKPNVRVKTRYWYENIGQWFYKAWMLFVNCHHPHVIGYISALDAYTKKIHMSQHWSHKQCVYIECACGEDIPQENTQAE